MQMVSRKRRNEVKKFKKTLKRMNSLRWSLIMTLPLVRRPHRSTRKFLKTIQI